MSSPDDGLTRQQKALLAVVLDAWRRSHVWPTFDYVTNRVGTNYGAVAELLRSFPVIGGEGPYGFAYGHVGFERTAPFPPPSSRVKLTARGLAFDGGDEEAVLAFVTALSLAAEKFTATPDDPDEVKQVTLTLDELQDHVGDGLHRDHLLAAGTLLSSEPFGARTGFSIGEAGAWTLTVDRGITRYLDVGVIEYFELLDAELAVTGRPNLAAEPFWTTAPSGRAENTEGAHLDAVLPPLPHTPPRTPWTDPPPAHSAAPTSTAAANRTVDRLQAPSVAQDPDFELQWPPSLLQSEIAQLLRRRSSARAQTWVTQAQLLMKDAFTADAAAHTFNELGMNTPADLISVEQVRLLEELQSCAPELLVIRPRRPYHSELAKGVPGAASDMAATVRSFLDLIADLHTRGYLEEAFGKDCPDREAPEDPSSVIARRTGRAMTWPPTADHLISRPEEFLDLTEMLYDLVSRPRDVWYHDFDNCGAHYSQFSRAAGQQLYCWLANRILDRSDVGWRLATEGEDIGRLVAVTDEARTDLARAMSSRTDADTGDPVRHALALYRGRGATVHDKRSAVVVLAGILERRRAGVLRTGLASKDESDLFQIANNFAIRHQKDDQKSQYDPAFLDWLFWWYLATIELTDTLLARQPVTGP